MKSQLTTSGSGARLLFKVLLANGWMLEETEKRAEILWADLIKPDARVPIDKVMKLARVAFEVSGDAALGLHLVDQYSSAPYHLITNLALSCDTVEQALEQWVRYASLESDTSRVEIRKEGGDTVLRYVDTSYHQAIWLLELYMATIITNCRKFVSKNVNPIEVRFRHKKPSYYQEYIKMFQCPIHFSTKENAIKFSRKDMVRLLPTRNPMVKTVLLRHADLALRKTVGIQNTRDQTVAWIVDILSKGKADLQQIAAAMNMDASTLQRKLKQENTTFTKLLNQTRQHLSLKYLHQGLSLKEITYLLNFSDPSTFQHAFKRWFGKSPGQYRKDL